MKSKEDGRREEKMDKKGSKETKVGCNNNNIIIILYILSAVGYVLSKDIFCSTINQTDVEAKHDQICQRKFQLNARWCDWILLFHFCRPIHHQGTNRSQNLHLREKKRGSA